MAVPRLKNTRSAERNKLSRAIKIREEGKETGGWRINIKKVGRTLEARNLPLTKKTSRPSNKQKKGRRRTNKGVNKRPAQA